LAESLLTKSEGLAVSISGTKQWKSLGLALTFTLSGNGEQITRLHLAQRIANGFSDSIWSGSDTHSILEGIFRGAFKGPLRYYWEDQLRLNSFTEISSLEATREDTELDLGVLLLTKETIADGQTICEQFNTL